MSACVQISVGEAGVPDFRKALEPMRQLLAEYPYLGGKDGPSYADHFIAGMFMVSHSPFIPLCVYLLNGCSTTHYSTQGFLGKHCCIQTCPGDCK